MTDLTDLLVIVSLGCFLDSGPVQDRAAHHSGPHHKRVDSG